jgi:hypothetical protein
LIFWLERYASSRLFAKQPGGTVVPQFEIAALAGFASRAFVRLCGSESMSASMSEKKIAEYRRKLNECRFSEELSETAGEKEKWRRRADQWQRLIDFFEHANAQSAATPTERKRGA